MPGCDGSPMDDSGRNRPGHTSRLYRVHRQAAHRPVQDGSEAMKPYYDHGGITIYHGDGRDVMPLTADVLLTDPPYGVELGKSDSRGDGHGLAKVGYLSYADTEEQWHALVPDAILSALSCVKRGAVFAGKHL